MNEEAKKEDAQLYLEKVVRELESTSFNYGAALTELGSGDVKNLQELRERCESLRQEQEAIRVELFRLLG